MNILNWIYEIRSYATAYTTRVKAWWLVALIWALVAACVVFFYGEAVSFGTWRPFAAIQTRIYAVAAIAAAYLAYCIYHLVRGLRRDEALIDAVSGTDPARAAQGDVAELQARLRDALRLLRRTMGRRSVYALPWYALIGPPGSGKTTALRNSGLRFPLADSIGESVEGVGGTRSCDWWFTDDAILIDTAGRYTAQDGDGEADAAGWRGFLRLLRKHRRRQPLNGAVVMLGVDTLVQATAPERLHHARTIRKRLRELDEAFGLRVPVYVVLTKVDRLAGFEAFFEAMPKSEREQVWGTTLALPKAGIEGRDLADRLGRAFDDLIARLNGLLLGRLQDEIDPERRARIFAFPSQLALVAEPLHEVLGEITASSRFDPPPRLRGLYLASAEQDGQVVDLVGRTASRHFGLDLPRFAAASAGGHRSYFLARLFRDVIFNEANLVATNPAAERRRRFLRLAAGGLAAALSLGLALVWLAAYLRQDDLLAATDMRLARYTAAAATLPVEDVADADFVRADAVLSGARDAAAPYGQDRPPRLLDTFDQRAKVEAGQANLYERALTGYLQPRLLVALATLLRAGDGAPEAGKSSAGKSSADNSSVDNSSGNKSASGRPDAGPPGSPGTEVVARALKARAEPAPGRPARKPGGAEAAPPAAPDLAEALRLYRMLGGEESLDRALATQRLSGLFARLYPEERQAPLRASLDGHVAALLSRPLIPIALDEGLLARAGDRAKVQDLAGRWMRAGGERACRTATERRYPFDRNAAAEVGLPEFSALFGPGGLFARFLRTDLADAVDTGTRPWRWRGQAAGDEAGDEAVLRSFETADEIRRAFFQTGADRPVVGFEVTPLRLDPEATSASLIADGQEVTYTRGSARPLTLTWPGERAVSQAARVVVQPGPPEAAAFTGPWALFRLVEAGRPEPAGPDRLRLAYDAGGHEASFELRSPTRPNPFALAVLRSFRCPRFR
ncbi:type VI secretion system membrane subunit TssM [Methylobacterium indicum]|uniref:type VI secretion system membrane subunit TssM n=2 Tax=Methylobacterium indicum TaxID=1775910 RepID=UPI00073406D8|nr:type VI secretion system membrane subunit TssM [Methylobacterium indicum]